ncbi:conserved hypothetical protein [Histoplasma capsulatum H143]|uniref:Uncharacterized protein n=1 Tax=Ajellomyces capsulatus (strain H143) TaxID=544712 RepID=C6H8X2_AJECH|nr:conserved hypothetical protein [Histoplasma capsulatum H143]
MGDAKSASNSEWLHFGTYKWVEVRCGQVFSRGRGKDGRAVSTCGQAFSRCGQVFSRVLKPTSSNIVQWQFHLKFLKHMKGLYCLGRQEQGALRTVCELAVFYKMMVYSDEQSESEGIEVDVQGDVDAYMEVLLDKWGMDWLKVCEIAQRTMKLQQVHAGTKEPDQIV